MLKPLLSKLQEVLHVKPNENTATNPMPTDPQPQQNTQPVMLTKTIGNKVISVKNVLPVPKIAPSTAPRYLFDTVQNTQHSIRVICDEEGLNFYEKSVIYACIEQESSFINRWPSGAPLINENLKRNKDGMIYIDPVTGNHVVTSRDWGLCQINDTPGWYIGKGLPFASTDDVMDHAEKVVRFMIHMAITGELNKWVSYTSGAYEKFMPINLLNKRAENGGRF